MVVIRCVHWIHNEGVSCHIYILYKRLAGNLDKLKTDVTTRRRLLALKFTYNLLINCFILQNQQLISTIVVVRLSFLSNIYRIITPKLTWVDLKRLS